MLQVQAWAEGSPWKRQFRAKNPSSVYVEVENYFVKSLSGWRGGAVTRQHLEAAKEALQRVDVVLLTEHLGGANTSSLLQSVFQGRGMGGTGMEKSNKVDRAEVQRLEALLAPDKVG